MIVGKQKTLPGPAAISTCGSRKVQTGSHGFAIALCAERLLHSKMLFTVYQLGVNSGKLLGFGALYFHPLNAKIHLTRINGGL